MHEEKLVLALDRRNKTRTRKRLNTTLAREGATDQPQRWRGGCNVTTVAALMKRGKQVGIAKRQSGKVAKRQRDKAKETSDISKHVTTRSKTGRTVQSGSATREHCNPDKVHQYRCERGGVVSKSALKPGSGYHHRNAVSRIICASPGGRN